MTDILGDQDGNEIVDQDGNSIGVIALNNLRISRLGSDPRRYLELPETNLSWFDLANKNYVNQSLEARNKVTFVNSDSYNINVTDRMIFVEYTTIDTVALQLPSANLFWNEEQQTGNKILIKDIGCNGFYKNITINAEIGQTIIDSEKEQISTIIDSNGGALWLQAISNNQWVVY